MEWLPISMTAAGVWVAEEAMEVMKKSTAFTQAGILPTAHMPTLGHTLRPKMETCTDHYLSVVLYSSMVPGI